MPRRMENARGRRKPLAPPVSVSPVMSKAGTCQTQNARSCSPPPLRLSPRAGIALPRRSSMIAAVDGPAASGKGTLASGLARHYRLPRLDTGLLYRAVGLAVAGKEDRPDLE